MDVGKLELAILHPALNFEQVEIELARGVRDKYSIVHVAPVFVSRAKGRGISVSTVVGYPLGLSKATVKAIEATVAIKDGADEVAIIPHFPNLKSLDLLKGELIEIARACRAARRDVFISVIVDLVGLDVEMICRAVRESGCDAVWALRADVEAVGLLKKFGEGLRIKAGGVSDLETVKKFFDAGADRVVLDSAVARAGEVL